MKPTHRTSHRDTGPRRIPRGASLTEALIVLLLATMTLGSAVPAFAELRDRKRLEAVAAQLETDLQLARAEAVAANRVLRLSFGSEAAGCYVLHTGSAQSCTCGTDPAGAAAATCTAGSQALRVAALHETPGVQLQANVGSMAFEPHRGTVTPTATLRLSNARDDRVHLVVNLMGRVRACSPTGTTGWQPC
jgi:type IV fimbrial biogenesis protein FimT